MIDPYVVLEKLLSTVKSNWEGAALPESQYVAPGKLVAVDGEQLTTNLTRIYPGRPSSPESWQYVGGEFYTADVLICLIRSSPTVTDGGFAPTPDDMQKNTKLLLADALELARIATNVVKDGAVFGQGVPVGIPSVEPYGPEGGFAGNVVTMSVQLV